jgi:glutamate-ammonia-ligase adenylyltransferase
MNSTYFTELVKGFIQTLQSRREGVFQIDLRLRPYGAKGALASSLRAYKAYYSGDGDARQFERLALVKQRPVAGNLDLAEQVMAARGRFIYWDDPLDTDDIQHIRSRQASELVKPTSVNVKHSLGGLVDIEYYVQASQISAGRRDRSVRGANTLDAVRSLAEGGYIRASAADEIRHSYSFLRMLIDALRVVRGNAKDLAVPDQHSPEFRYLAQRLRFESPGELADAISDCMEYSRGVWDREPVPA